MKEPIYLDHHSASPPLPEVLETFSRISKEYWGSITSPHFVGQQPMYPLQKAIDSLLEKLGAQEKDELFFMRNEEAIWRLFFQTYLQVSRESGKTLFLTAQGQEVAYKKVCLHMQELGCSHKTLRLNAKGQITRQVLEEAITPRTALLSLSWADGLTGVIHPIDDLAEACKEKGVLFHVDATYVLGKRFFRFQDLGAQFLTIDGFCIEALQDTGLLLIKEGTIVQPDRFAPSLPFASTLTLAVGERQNKFEHYCMEVARLRDLLEMKLQEQIEEAVIFFKESDRLPNVSVVAFPGVYAESLLYLLNSKGIYATVGDGKFPPLESVLIATGVSKELASCALSLAFSADISEEQIEYISEVLVFCAKQLKSCSKEIKS